MAKEVLVNQGADVECDYYHFRDILNRSKAIIENDFKDGLWNCFVDKDEYEEAKLTSKRERNVFKEKMWDEITRVIEKTINNIADKFKETKEEYNQFYYRLNIEADEYKPIRNLQSLISKIDINALGESIISIRDLFLVASNKIEKSEKVSWWIDEKNVEVGPYRNVFELYTEGDLREIFDSRAYLLYIQRLIDSDEFLESEHLYGLGDKAYEFLQRNTIRKNWLFLDQKVREMFEKQGFCPIGIDKDECKITWKRSNNVRYFAHKDIDDIRIGLSNKLNGIFLIPRYGNKIALDKFQDAMKEAEEILENLGGELSSAPFYHYKELSTIVDDYINFNLPKNGKFICINVLKEKFENV